MKKSLAILLPVVMIASPMSWGEVVNISKFQGLFRNPKPYKINDAAHSMFDDVYIKDDNIQVVKGRSKMNTTAHTDTTVNGLWLYETPTISGDASTSDLLLHCNGTDGSTTIKDSSPDVRGNATVNGNAQIDTAQYKFGGGSCLFDGASDSIQFADDDDWTPDTSFTVDFWVMFNSVASDQAFLFHGSGLNDFWVFKWTTANTLVLINQSAGVNTINLSWSWTPSTLTWYHVALVKEGNDFEVFINGTSLGTYTDTDSFNNFANLLTIGGNTQNNTLWFNGWIDELRIDDGEAKYTANFTPNTSEYSLFSNNSVQKIVAVESDEVVSYDWDGTNRTVILSGITSEDFDFVQVGQALWFTSDNNGLYRWTGSGTASQDASAPKYGIIEQYKGVLFLAQKTNLRYSSDMGSSPGTVTLTWASSNHLVVGEGQYDVTDLERVRDSLVIFTQGSIQELTGFGASSFRLKNLATGIGAVNSHTTAKDRNGDVIFFSGIPGVFKLQLGGQLTDSQTGTIIDRTSSNFECLSCGAMDDVFRGNDSQIDLDPTTYGSAHAYYDLETDLYHLFIDEHEFIYDNINKTWSHIPGSKMEASDYLMSSVDSASKRVLADDVGFFWEDWVGYARNPGSGTLTGNPTSSTSTTLTDTSASFYTTGSGLKGVWVVIEDGTTKSLEWKRISSNTAITLTVESAWDSNPGTDDTYYIGYIVPHWESKQFNIDPPNELSLQKVDIVFDIADSAQNLVVNWFDDRTTTYSSNQSFTIDLSGGTETSVEKYFETIGIMSRSPWVQLEFRSFVSNTSDTISPPVNISNYNLHILKKEKE